MTRYQVRLIVEQLSDSFGVEWYDGEVHGEDLTEFETLDSAREAAVSYVSILAENVGDITAPKKETAE